MASAMQPQQTTLTAEPHGIGATLCALGAGIMRYGLVLVIVWIGGMKFTSYEANGIQPLVAQSPLMSWAYQIMSVQAFSSLLGVVEILTGVFLALRPFARKLAVLGGVMAVLTFLTTLTFLFSTPGWEASLGFPALSAMPGQFLLKDIVLLGVSCWCLGEALQASPA